MRRAKRVEDSCRDTTIDVSSATPPSRFGCPCPSTPRGTSRSAPNADRPMWNGASPRWASSPVPGPVPEEEADMLQAAGTGDSPEPTDRRPVRVGGFFGMIPTKAGGEEGPTSTSAPSAFPPLLADGMRPGSSGRAGGRAGPGRPRLPGGALTPGGFRLREPARLGQAGAEAHRSGRCGHSPCPALAVAGFLTLR